MSVANYIITLDNGKSIIDYDKDGVVDAKNIVLADGGGSNFYEHATKIDTLTTENSSLNAIITDLQARITQLENTALLNNSHISFGSGKSGFNIRLMPDKDTTKKLVINSNDITDRNSIVECYNLGYINFTGGSFEPYINYGLVYPYNSVSFEFAINPSVNNNTQSGIYSIRNNTYTMGLQLMNSENTYTNENKSGDYYSLLPWVDFSLNGLMFKDWVKQQLTVGGNQNYDSNFLKSKFLQIKKEHMNNCRVRFDYLNDGTTQINPVDGVATNQYLKITMERFADYVLSYDKKTLHLFRNPSNTSSPIKFILNGTHRSRVGAQPNGGNNFTGIMKHFIIYVEDETTRNDRTLPSIVLYQRPKIIKNGNEIKERYDIEIFGDIKCQNALFIGNKNVGDAIGAITYNSNSDEGKSNDVVVSENNAINPNPNDPILDTDTQAIIFDSAGNVINTGIVNPATDTSNQFINDMTAVGNGISSLF